MLDSNTYSRGDLTSFRGVDHDALQYWFREGLLLPEPAEPRKHRRFAEGEAKIAALLGEARSQGLNIGALRVIAQTVRSTQQFHADLIRRLGNNPNSTQQAEAVEDSPDQTEQLFFAWNIEDCAGLFGLHLDDEGGWHLDTFRSSEGPKFRSEIIFNLGLILEAFNK